MRTLPCKVYIVLRGTHILNMLSTIDTATTTHLYESINALEPLQSLGRSERHELSQLLRHR